VLVLLCENFLYSYQAAGFAGGSSLRAALRPVLGASKAKLRHGCLAEKPQPRWLRIQDASTEGQPKLWLGFALD